MDRLETQQKLLILLFVYNLYSSMDRLETKATINIGKEIKEFIFQYG